MNGLRYAQRNSGFRLDMPVDNSSTALLYRVVSVYLANSLL